MSAKVTLFSVPSLVIDRVRPPRPMPQHFMFHPSTSINSPKSTDWLRLRLYRYGHLSPQRNSSFLYVPIRPNPSPSIPKHYIISHHAFLFLPPPSPKISPHHTSFLHLPTITILITLPAPLKTITITITTTPKKHHRPSPCPPPPLNIPSLFSSPPTPHLPSLPTITGLGPSSWSSYRVAFPFVIHCSRLRHSLMPHIWDFLGEMRWEGKMRRRKIKVNFFLGEMKVVFQSVTIKPLV